MTSISTTHSSIWSSGARQYCFSRGFIETRGKRHLGLSIPYRSSFCPSHDLVYSNCHHMARKHAIVCSSQLNNSDAGEPEDENSERESSQPDGLGVCYSSSIMGYGKNYHPLSTKKHAIDFVCLVCLDIVQFIVVNGYFKIKRSIWFYENSSAQRSLKISEEEELTKSHCMPGKKI